MASPRDLWFETQQSKARHNIDHWQRRYSDLVKPFNHLSSCHKAAFRAAVASVEKEAGDMTAASTSTTESTPRFTSTPEVSATLEEAEAYLAATYPSSPTPLHTSTASDTVTLDDLCQKHNWRELDELKRLLLDVDYWRCRYESLKQAAKDFVNTRNAFNGTKAHPATQEFSSTP